jgi:hypothetical protein
MTNRHLYYVEPMGVGSPEIEALSSYVIRLSIAHGATIGMLMSYLSPSDTLEGEAWWRSLCSSRTATYIRPNATNEKFVGLLGAASTVPDGVLRSMTFLSLHSVIARSMNAFSEHARWCRYCLMEWKRSFQTPYLKLIWHLNEVEVCPIHRCELSNTCATCGRFQDGRGAWSAIDECCYCGAFLGGGTHAGPIVPSWSPHMPELLELVTIIGSAQDHDLRKDGIRRVVEWFCAESIDLSQWLMLADPIVRNHLRILAYNPEKTFTLQAAIEICRVLNIRLRDLLEGRITGTNTSFPFGQLPLGDSKDRRRRRALGTREEMTKRVKAFVDSFPSHHAPSLREVARHVGASVGGLYHLIPAQCVQIARQHKLDEAFLSTKLSFKLHRFVLRIIANWDERADGPMSRKAIWRRVRAKNIYPKNLFRLEIGRLFGILDEDSGRIGKIVKIDRVKPRRMPCDERVMPR